MMNILKMLIHKRYKGLGKNVKFVKAILRADTVIAGGDHIFEVDIRIEQAKTLVGSTDLLVNNEYIIPIKNLIQLTRINLVKTSEDE